MRAGITAVMVGVACAAGLAHGDSGPLTLEQAIQLALAHNERSGIAELDVEVAEAGVDKARVAFLPVLAAGGTNAYTPWDKAPHDVTRGQLQFTWNAISPSAWPLYAEAKHSLEGQRAQSIDDKRQLAFDAAKAYLSVLLAGEVVQAAQKKLDTAKANVDSTEAQFKAQLVSSNDVTRAQIDLSGSQRELDSDRGSLEAAYVQLAFVVNAPVPRGLAPPDKLLAASAAPLPAIDALVAAAVKQRPDLVARRESALAAHDFAREPRYRYLPTLGLQATTTATTSAPQNGKTVDGSLAITAAWTLFDGGSRTADARSRDAQAAIADLQTQELARSIDAQVRTAATELASAQQALVSARDAMTASQKSADETAILYRQGLAKAIELVDANEQRFLAEVNYDEAEFAVASAYLGLLQALGKGPLDAEVP